MYSWIRCRVDLYVFFFIRRFNVLCYASGFFMLFLRHVFMMHVCVCVCVCECEWVSEGGREGGSERACVRACVRVCARVYVCVVIVHWHCSVQLSMFSMEKRYRNKIIIIIITPCTLSLTLITPCTLALTLQITLAHYPLHCRSPLARYPLHCRSPFTRYP